MQTRPVYEVCAPDVVAEDFGGEIVVLNLLNGKYFSLLDVSADIWRDLALGYRPQDIIDHTAAARPDLEASVVSLIEGMIHEELIRPRAEAVGWIAPAEVASSAASLALCATVPQIEAFDDMAELILADPIHDVEADIGWPVRRDPAQSA